MLTSAGCVGDKPGSDGRVREDPREAAGPSRQGGEGRQGRRARDSADPQRASRSGLAVRGRRPGRRGDPDREDDRGGRSSRKGDHAVPAKGHEGRDRRRESLPFRSPSPLERLLAERVVATWLQIQLFEGLYASGMSKNMTIAQGSYHQKRLDQTYRRHLSAIRALAQMRKLLKGTAITQINIADKQINTTG